MKNLEKIIELLEKKKLDPEEKSLLENILLEDEESGKFYTFYKKITEIVKDSTHIDEEDLAEYILFRNEIKSGNLRGSLIPKVEDHLRKCSECSENFKRLNEEYSELDNFLTAGKTAEPAAAGLTKHVPPGRKYLYAVFAAAAVIFLLLIVVSDLSTPYYYEYADLNDQNEFYITRGRGTLNFQESLRALEDHNYGKAIYSLRKDIIENPDDETIFYSYYIAGLSYMKAAEKSILGLFPHYDEVKSAEALKNFQKAIEKNTSGKYPNITLNACFYAGKACLMMDNLPLARDYFKKVVSGRGSKMNEAGKILSELE